MSDIDMGQYEIMDRTYLVMEIIDNQIYEHPSIHKNQKKLLDKCFKLLNKVYQSAGNNSLK